MAGGSRDPSSVEDNRNVNHATVAGLFAGEAKGYTLIPFAIVIMLENALSFLDAEIPHPMQA